MKTYKPTISARINRKGVLDVDTVKGCRIGMGRYPNGGCYGLCYAAKLAKFYRYDFSNSVSRSLDENPRQLKLFNDANLGGPKEVYSMAQHHDMDWFRIGVMGDPCHDWPLTVNVCEWLGRIKTPVIVTKHWLKIPDDMLERMRLAGVVFNTSISPLDTEQERYHRLAEYRRLRDAGIKSVLRVVSCRFGDTYQGEELAKIQQGIFQNSSIIDNPLRIPPTDQRVIDGHIKTKRIRVIKALSHISIDNENTYIGHCKDCPDQCGVN